MSSLQHYLSVCQLENQKVYMCLDINHAILDAHSRGIIMRDLQTTYSEDALNLHTAQFKEFIFYLEQQPQEEARRYRAEYLDGTKPCCFPSMVSAREELRSCRMVQVPALEASAIRLACQAWEITPATVIKTAWALVLSRHTGSTTPCFGNLISGRDLPITDVNEIFGSLITMPTCRVHLSDKTVLEVLRSVQNDYVNSLSYQTYPIASMRKMLGLKTSTLFNTSVNLQRMNDMGRLGASGVDIDFYSHDDLSPDEVSWRPYIAVRYCG